MPAGKRLAPCLAELVAVLRRFGELDIDEDTAALLAGMSAATIDRRLAPERKKHELKGRCHTKPGSLLKSQIPVRTWADWDDAVPGFVEIDLVGHDGGNAAGEHAFTLTVTDIATGWTENRSVRNKARKWVLAALDDIARAMPFPILGVDSDNGSEFINHHLLALVPETPDHLHPVAAGQQERRLPRRAEELGHRAHRGRLPPLRHRRRTVAAQQDLGTAVAADQLLLPAAKARLEGPRRRESVQEIRPCDHPAPPRGSHSTISAEDKAILADTHASINPAAVQRRIQALTAELLTLTTTKAAPKTKAPIAAPSMRASSDESTTQTSRAS